MFKKIRYKFKYEIRYWPRDFTKGVKNLITWFPIIWKDRQWDHQYIYGIFRKKLHLTEQFIRHNGIHVNNIDDADKMKICVDLLDRIMKDEYHKSAFKQHEKKWGKADLQWEDIDDEKGYSKLNIIHPNVKTDEDKESERKDFRRSSKHEADLREQDLDLLFKMMRKHIQSWWD
jgi:hypothetical protein